MKKRLIIATIIACSVVSCPCYAGKFSPETEKLMREAGLQVDYDDNEILQKAQEVKSGKTETQQTGNKKKNIKTKNDEFKCFGNASNSVKVTDTEDELHIYSNTYSNPSGYSKYSNDEFRIYGQDTKANDGYSEDNFDQLHIDYQYQGKLWRPDHEVIRLSIDEIRLPNDPY